MTQSYTRFRHDDVFLQEHFVNYCRCITSASAITATPATIR